MNLSESQLSEFEDNGYMIVRRLASSDVCDRMLAITQEHLQVPAQPLEYETDVAYPGAPSSLSAPGGTTIRRLRGAYGRDACFRVWAEDRNRVAKLAQILGEQVSLSLAHHNCIMTKHPSYGTATGWHRDIRYWSFKRPDLICVWLALGPETAANGGLKFIPGSHRLDVKPTQLDASGFLRPDVRANLALFAQNRQIELNKGDVVFFHSGLFHSAGRNTTATIKASVAFAYHGASNTPIEGSKSATIADIMLGP